MKAPYYLPITGLLYVFISFIPLGNYCLLRHDSLLHILSAGLFYLPYRTGPLRIGSIGHLYLCNTRYVAEGAHKIFVDLLKNISKNNMAL